MGVAVGLIRAGTYSPNTRAVSLLHFTPDAELNAFLDYDADTNPLRIGRAQALLLLYALLENDGEVVAPLFQRLVTETDDGFSDREAGDLLPEIYRAFIKRHSVRLLSAEERDRLEVLSKVADNIEKWRGRSYTGGGARENTVRVRLEPFTDIGLLSKPDTVRYNYELSQAGRAWAEAWADVESDAEVSDFLKTRFFATAATAWEVSGEPITQAEQIVPHLHRAWRAIQSAGGYGPIKEMALVAGIEALLEHGLIIELSVARAAIIAYQKANPYKVSFSVNRMGELAHARFLEAPNETSNAVRNK